uniref:tRNA(Ile)-lysidine synthase n=1 Tax=Eiseniibacteriota bacterium TaxID=2212470 RepID=A0A832I2P5_UNCEI
MRLRRVEPVLRRSLRSDCALPPGSRVLVAASGGADSTALLLALQRVAPEFGLSVAAAHLHHGLRGADADADLAFVRALCSRLGVPLVAARWDARRRMRRRGLSGQDGLRRLRREFLAAAARRAGAGAIATAHTADDQMETVLLRLLRGAGLPGLGGMRARRGRWLKPLLGATRADIEADLRRAGEAWREDASNASPAYARNRLRREAIPALIAALDPRADPARARPALARRVAAAAREARDAERALGRWIRPVLPRVSRIQGAEFALDSRGVGSYPVAFQRALLRRWWRGIAGAGTGLTHRHLDALCHLLAKPRRGARVLLPAGWVAEPRADTLRIRHAGHRRHLRESR